MKRNQHLSRRPNLRLERLEDRSLLTAGVLDPTFGSGGIVTTNVGLPEASHEAAYAVALQPDGKIVAVGRASAGLLGRSFSDFRYDPAVVRYNTNGTLDNTFSGDGKTITPLEGSPSDVEIQSDGKIVVAGGDSGAFSLVRYLTDGSIDTSFGGKAKGIVKTNIGKNTADGAMAMELQGDGRMVLAGITRANNSSLYDLGLVRYNVDGSLDSTFSGDGKTSTHFSSPVSPRPVAMELAIYPSTSAQAGKIVVVSDLLSDNGVIVARYNSNGSLDTSFGGGGGYVTLASLGSPYDLGPSVAIQNDDRIVISLNGRGSGGTDGGDVYLARLLSNGSPDSAFGGSGIVRALNPEAQTATSIALQPDGKIVVAGWYTGSQSFAMRFSTNGTLDATFGTNGLAIVAGVTIVNSYQVDVAIQPDGKLVLAGGTPGGDFALARLQADDPPAALQTASVSNHAVAQTLSHELVAPFIKEATARWQSTGVDVSPLFGIEVRIADLGGTTLGLASGNTIWLDDNAAGWGWFVDSTLEDDSEFTTPGNQGEQNRMDLLSVVMHELGHVLGLWHDKDGVMADTLAAGVRQTSIGRNEEVLVDMIFAQCVDDVTSGTAPKSNSKWFVELHLAR